jgi:hypothetical protein
MQDRKLLLPVGINFEEVLRRQRGLTVKTRVYAFHLKSFCHILALKTIQRFEEDEDEKRKELPYISFMAALIQKNVCKDYTCVIEILRRENIIDIDRAYIVGGKPRGYRFSESVIENGIEWTEVKLRRIENKKFVSVQENTVGAAMQLEWWDKRGYLLEHLTNGGLTIDPKARDCLDVLYKEKRKTLRAAFDRTNSTQCLALRIFETQMAFENQVHIIKKIEDGIAPPDCLIDNSGYRIHSPVTRLKRELRSFLSYSGDSLMEIDIKCSQPFFTLLLLNWNYWNDPRFAPELKLTKTNPALWDYIQVCESDLFSIMIGKSPVSSETTTGIDFEIEHYRQILTQSDLYTEIGQWIEVYTRGHGSVSRDRIKVLVCKYLYGPVPTKNRPIVRKYFEANFPAINQFFDAIKAYKSGEMNYREFAIPTDTGYKQMSYLMQRIESVSILDVVCKRLAQEFPEIPLITIHDCILTTPGNVETVYQVFMEELTGLIGSRPRIKKPKKCVIS